MTTYFTPPPQPVTEPRPIQPGTPAGWSRIPTMESDESTDREFVARVINHRASIRNWAVTQAALNERFYLGDQWIRPLARTIRDGLNYRFRLDRRYPRYLRSTTNLIAAAADNQITRISLREFVPNAQPRRGASHLETAARAAKSYLLHHLGQIAWEGDKREDAIAHMVIHATVGLVSYWEQRWLNEPRILSTAMECPACGEVYGNTRLPEAMVSAFGANLDAVRRVEGEPDAEPEVTFGVCVTCDSREPLREYEPTKSDLLRVDRFGLPLGLAEPGQQGGGQLEVLPIFRMFPENGGCGTQPNTLRYCGYEVPRSLEWVAEHLGDKLDVDALYPEDPRSLFGSDPILGGEYHQWWSAQGDVGVYDAHALVKTIVIQPQWGLEKGLVLTQVNDQVVKEPLLVPFETATGERREVERVKVALARYKRIPGLFWGRTPFSDAIGIQRRINRIDTMQDWMREHGQPQMYLPETVKITNVSEDEDEDGLALRQFQVHNAPQGFRVGDAITPAIPMTGNVYEQQRRAAIQDLSWVFGPVSVERGIVTPHDPKTTSGLALIRNEAAKEREPAEAAFSQMCEIAWGHQLELTYAFVTEEDTYAVKTASGRRELRAFAGADIMDHVDVEIEMQDEDEPATELRDGTAQAIQLGLYDTGDPDARDKALENMRLPRNVNERYVIQQRNAEAAWRAFVTKWEIPAIDYALHDPQTWFSVLGRRWIDDDGREIQIAARWDALLPRLAGWRENLALESDRDARQRAAYGAVPPEDWAARYAELRDAYGRARSDAAAAAAAAVGAGAPSPQPDAIPEPPPPPDPAVGFLPMALDLRIALVLRRMLGLPTDIPHPTARGLTEEGLRVGMVNELIRMYAVILAYGELRRVPQAPAPGGRGEPAAQPQTAEVPA